MFRRVDDLPARYGGEEFAVIIPGATADQAAFSAEMFRKAVETRAVAHADSTVAEVVTVSIGPAIMPGALKAEEIGRRVEDWIEGEMRRISPQLYAAEHHHEKA